MKLFPGSDQDRSCWNRGRTGHRHIRYREPLNAVKKAEFLGNKKTSCNGSQRVLFELGQGLEDLLNMNSNDAEAVASSYFGDGSDVSSDTDSELQESELVKEVDPTMKFGHAFVLDQDSELDF